MAVYLYNDPNDCDYDYKKIKKWFEISASFGDVEGNYHYGRMLYDEGKYERAYKFILYAAERNEKRALALLGDYFKLKDDYNNASKYYKQAITCNNFNAAYQLAIMYLEIKTDDPKEKTLYRNMADEYLEKYYNLFSDEIKDKAKPLLGKKF